MKTKPVSYKGCKSDLPENVSITAYKSIVEASNGFFNIVQPMVNILSGQIQYWQSKTNKV